MAGEGPATVRAEGALQAGQGWEGEGWGRVGSGPGWLFLSPCIQPWIQSHTGSAAYLLSDFGKLPHFFIDKNEDDNGSTSLTVYCKG